MVDKQAIEIAAQAAADWMRYTLAFVSDEKVVEEAVHDTAYGTRKYLTEVRMKYGKGATVYFGAFQQMIEYAQLDKDAIRDRIIAWAATQYDPNDRQLISSIVGNMLKNVENPNMGNKTFFKLVRALFPE